jgi:potassium/chloride transporter 4/5/6
MKDNTNDNSHANTCLFLDNLGDFFLQEGQYIAMSKDPEEIQKLDRPVYNQVFADTTTTFTILIGIFFPSVTGM